MSKPNIIYIYSYESPFIQKDIAFLQEKYLVQTQFFNWTNKAWVPIFIIRQLVDLLLKSNSSTVYIIMFAGFWSVVPVWLAKLLGRRSLVIVGGSDCVSFPEFNYGALRKRMQSATIKYSLKNCTTILPVAEQLIESNYTYLDTETKNQGYRSFFPEITTPAKVIYNGYDVPPTDSAIEKKPNSFICVARIDNEVVYQLKGIDLIVDAARLNPDFVFTIVGIYDEVIQHFGLGEISNLTCHSFLEHSQLDELYTGSQFYMCLSISEGFPNALCEGMSNGCIPIGSQVSSIPFIIDDTGFVLEKRDTKMLDSLLKKVGSLAKDELEILGRKAHQRIESEFNLERRKKSFYELIG